MDEWAVRRAVMKTGLGGKKVRIRGGVGGNMKERESRVCRKKGREIEKSNERWRRQREQDGEKIGRCVEKKWMKWMMGGLGEMY